jgi:hypothetical protein
VPPEHIVLKWPGFCKRTAARRQWHEAQDPKGARFRDARGCGMNDPHGHSAHDRRSRGSH